MGNYDEKDFGPEEIGAMFGLCIGLYIKHGVKRKDLLKLARDLYNDISAGVKERKVGHE